MPLHCVYNNVFHNKRFISPKTLTPRLCVICDVIIFLIVIENYGPKFYIKIKATFKFSSLRPC